MELFDEPAPPAAALNAISASTSNVVEPSLAVKRVNALVNEVQPEAGPSRPRWARS